MKTPGHVVVNAAVVGAAMPGAPLGGILAGALIPDVPIALLWLYGRIVKRVDDERVWRELYPQPWFLALVHGLHSFFVGGVALALGMALDSVVLVACATSQLLHASLDLPIHGEDAHRHLWPLSQAKFISPISYWDVHRHARVVALFEAALAIGAATLLVVNASTNEGLRTAALVVAAWYPLHYVVVFLRRPGAAA